MHCQICGNELNNCVCSDCGFDLSRCAELYPTLALPADPGAALWRRRRMLFLQNRQAPPPCPAATAAAPTALPLTKRLKAGETVRFGSYQQKTGKAGKDRIEWTVLCCTDSKALLISSFALDVLPFHDRWQSVSWADCSLRAWLNGAFLRSAFSAMERRSLIRTQNHIISRRLFPAGRNDDAQEDMVFLLSAEEAIQYFPNPAARSCRPTSYARSKITTLGASCMSNRCRWWLRSSGTPASFAAYVEANGSMEKAGCRVDASQIAVRPAIWVPSVILR